MTTRLRRAIGWLHLWIGLLLSLPLVLLGLSGSILVFEDELRGLFDPLAHRVATPGEARPVAEIIAAARAAGPAGLAPVFYAAPAAGESLATVRLAQASRGVAGPGASPLRIRVDPVTLQAFPDAEGDGFLRWLASLHASALVPGGTGRTLIGWLGVAMLALGVSGLVNWWPRPGRWRRAFSVRRGARGVLLQRDLHAAVGIWGAAVLLVVSASGVYLAFPAAIRTAVDSVLPVRDFRASLISARVEPVKGATPMTVDGAIALARTAVPTARLGFVFLPARPDQPFRVTLQPPRAAHGAPAITVVVDPWTHGIDRIVDPRDFNAAETALAWQRALHAGEGFGWIWKILVALAGLLPLVFAATGIAFWWQKRRAARRQAPRPGRVLEEVYSTGGADE
ncbi:MAG TPA: PepSY-associated TM helix domain-containing protein [Stellaceae bacterium]|nr:PepSY-associated TM helix domain-containing protein [Stellaceae bacterium]